MHFLIEFQGTAEAGTLRTAAGDLVKNLLRTSFPAIGSTRVAIFQTVSGPTKAQVILPDIVVSQASAKKLVECHAQLTEGARLSGLAALVEVPLAPGMKPFAAVTATGDKIAPFETQPTNLEWMSMALKRSDQPPTEGFEEPSSTTRKGKTGAGSGSSSGTPATGSGSGGAGKPGSAK